MNSKQNAKGWPSSPDTTVEAINAIQAGLTVRLIMTPRDELMTCGVNETISSVLRRNSEGYSTIPVVEGDGRICGFLHAEKWPNYCAVPPEKTVEEDIERLCDSHRISESTSILDFVRANDELPTRLVFAGDDDVGLVCAADLQRMPVRVALFSIITALELAMADRIRLAWPNSDDWLNLLGESRRSRTKRMVEKAKEEDRLLSAIAETLLEDKVDIVRKKGLVDMSISDRDAIRDLRDAVAHANAYAGTRDGAKETARTVARIFEITDHLRQAIAE